MLWRVAVIVAAVGYVAYRLSLALQIARARRAGDLEREQRLRSRGFGLYRWAVAFLAVFVVVLILLVWSNSR